MKTFLSKHLKELLFLGFLLILLVALNLLSMLDAQYLTLCKTFFISLLGGALYVFWNAKRHIIGGSFSYEVWREKALNAVIYSTAFLFIGVLVLHVEPRAKDVFQLFGIDLLSQDSSFTLLGTLFFAATMSVKRDITKTKDERQANDNANSGEE
jgi:hypothetical protein